MHVIMLLFLVVGSVNFCHRLSLRVYFWCRSGGDGDGVNGIDCWEIVGF